MTDDRKRKRGPYAEMVDLCKAEARKGADALHAKAATHTKPPQLTDAESAAKARARLEKETR